MRYLTRRQLTAVLDMVVDWYENPDDCIDLIQHIVGEYNSVQSEMRTNIYHPYLYMPPSSRSKLTLAQSQELGII